LNDLTPNLLETHELSIWLTDAGKADKKAVNPKLFVTTHYYPCETIASGHSNDALEDGDTLSEVATEGYEDGSGMGILFIKNLTLEGVQTNAGMNLTGKLLLLELKALINHNFLNMLM